MNQSLLLDQATAYRMGILSNLTNYDDLQRNVTNQAANRSQSLVRSDWTSETIERAGAPWLTWIMAAVAAALVVVVLLIMYDLFCRCTIAATQNIFDGGPPTSPGHQYFYKVALCADEASPNFDQAQSVLKFELIDAWNRYLGTIVVPTYVLRFKQEREPPLQPMRDFGPKSKEPHGKKDRQLPMQLNPEHYELRQTIDTVGVYKSMTDLREIWSDTPVRQSILAFRYIRRTPLTNLNSIRVNHDCYERNAYFKLKTMVLYDESRNEYHKFDFRGKPLRALHPCPPNKQQVFQAEQVVNDKQIAEIKAFASSARQPNWLDICCPCRQQQQQQE